MPLGCCWDRPWPSWRSNKLSDPTCFPACMCVFPSAACVCFINSRAALKAPPGRKRDIHWSNETLFWAFTFTLFYGDLCVCTGFTRSLERSHFIQPESGGVFSFLFLLLLLSELKLPPGFKAALWGGSAGAAGWQCYRKTVQEMSVCHSASEQLCNCFIAVFPDSGHTGVDLWRHFCEMLFQIERVCHHVKNWFMLVCIFSHHFPQKFFIWNFFCGILACCYFYFGLQTLTI